MAVITSPSSDNVAIADSQLHPFWYATSVSNRIDGADSATPIDCATRGRETLCCYEACVARGRCLGFCVNVVTGECRLKLPNNNFLDAGNVGVADPDWNTGEMLGGREC